MVATVKTVAHLEACVTNHRLIKLIMLDALGQQRKTLEEFKRKTPRTSWGKQTTTSGGSQTEVET